MRYFLAILLPPVAVMRGGSGVLLSRLFLGALLLVGCYTPPPPSLACRKGEECVGTGGFNVPVRCVPSPTSELSWCAAATDLCASGWRWTTYVEEPGLSGTCVVEALQGDAGVDPTP